MKLKRLIAIILICSMTLTSCAARGNVVDRTNTELQSTLIGATIGAGLAIASSFFIKDKKTQKAVILIITFLSLTFAKLYGRYVADEKERIYKTNKDIAELKAYIDAKNNKLTHDIVLLKQNITRLYAALELAQQLHWSAKKTQKKIEDDVHNFGKELERLEKETISLAIEINNYKDKNTDETSLEEFLSANPEVNHLYNNIYDNATQLDLLSKEMLNIANSIK